LTAKVRVHSLTLHNKYRKYVGRVVDSDVECRHPPRLHDLGFVRVFRVADKPIPVGSFEALKRVPVPPPVLAEGKDLLLVPENNKFPVFDDLKAIPNKARLTERGLTKGQNFLQRNAVDRASSNTKNEEMANVFFPIIVAIVVLATLGIIGVIAQAKGWV